MFTITAAAEQQLVKIMGETEAEAIKIAMKRSGCSGYMYYLDFAREMPESYISLAESPVKVITEDETMPFLKDVTLDYIQEGLNRSFKFKNPAAKGECGCGDSFML